MHRIAALVALLLITSCASQDAMPGVADRVAALPATDVLLLGEQHDAPEHQRIHREVITLLAARGALAAVALEMAPQGGATKGLQRDASEAAVREALRWDEAGWPWAAYGPAIMAAVRAGVPVVGANLPRTALRPAMSDAQLDQLLPGPALQAQQQAIREGHCDMLPESQVAPMTRVQIARDRAIAQTLAQWAVPGKTVVLLAGAGHVDRQLGVPLHLPASLRSTVVALRAGPERAAATDPASFDSTWRTPPVPAKDYCAEFRKGMPRS